MAKKKLPKWATRVTPFSKFVALSLFIFLPILAFYYGRYYEKITERQVQNLQQLSSAPSATKSDNHESVNTFTSQDLGVSFTYVIDGNQPLFVKEINNRVYLYSQFGKVVQKPEDGKFVEVFSKKSTQSLRDTIKENFLQGYSQDDCPIVSANLNRTYFLPNHEYLQIATPRLNANENTIFNQEKAVAKCPPLYTFTRNGISYFMMDNNHPNKFVFFELGQDNILGKSPVDNNHIVTWDQTLRFL